MKRRYGVAIPFRALPGEIFLEVGMTLAVVEAGRGRSEALDLDQLQLDQFKHDELYHREIARLILRSTPANSPTAARQSFRR
jgi:hypothetical protein